MSKYDIPVLGMKDGTFCSTQIVAISCILFSFLSAVAVIISAFTRLSWRDYFKTWSKCERFSVYCAICDALFNVSHFADHLHMYISQGHVEPLFLCEFYGFFVFEFISTQYLIVLIISINAFVIIRFNKQFGFGKWDWKFIVVCYGTPFLLCVICLSLDEMGPTGAFCGIHGRLANLFFSTIPQVVVLLTISVLYTLTWLKIRSSSLRIREKVPERNSRKSKDWRAAKMMTLFVVVFVIQFWASGVYAVWQTVTTPPSVLLYLVVVFTNIGGFLNGLVYCMIVIRDSQLKETRGNERTSNIAAVSVV